MRKSTLLRVAGMLLTAVLAFGGLTSCGDVTVWSPAPPNGWNTFFDRRLNGTWELVQANGRPVSGYAVNYLTFNGDGRGRYYYYDNGYQESERMAYWCQDAVSGASRYQMNIQYEYSSPTTVNYWFDQDARYDYLYMQWGTGAGVVTYVYAAVAGPGW